MSTICDDLRAAILQAAMQGKLTERLEADDNSERIKEQIIAERSQYKNCKFLDNSNDSADFPDEWRSLKTGEVFELLIGEKVVSGHKLPLLDAKYFRGKQKTFTDKGNLANKDDVLILVDGENSGETFLCTEPGYMGSTFKALFIPKCLNKDFALYFLEMNRKVLRDNKRGSAIPHLDKKLFFNFVFPIPSLAEQKRIVEKVDELMARVADLEQSADALASLKKAFPDDIKASLSQAAMQGKLTEQLPEDGDVEDLLKKIKAEKEKLIAEGKIKKQKPLAPITDDEIPFIIPKSWRWVRLGDLSALISDGTHKTPKYVDEGVPFLSVQNISKGYFDFTKIKFISTKEHVELTKRIKPTLDDLLICRIGTLGKALKNTLDQEFSIFVSLGVIRLVDTRLADYITEVINSPVGYKWIQENKVGGGTHTYKINLSDLPNMLIPLPPLAEQKRISERLDTLMQNINVVGELIASE